MEELLIKDGTPGYHWGIEHVIECAEKSGFEIVRSTETTLLLDLDDGASKDIYERVFRTIAPLFALQEIERWASKSGKGLHVVLSCKPMEAAQRIALQACLGSDKVRESLAIGMLIDGIKNPIVLFKPGRMS
jgi:hypothetical protein